MNPITIPASLLNITTRHNSALEAKVAARNHVNTLVNELRKVVIPFFAQYVGKKIKRADNSLLASVKEEINPVLETFRNSNKSARINIYFSISEYSISLVCIVDHMFMKNGYDSSQRGENSFYIGHFARIPDSFNHSGILEKITEYDESNVLKTDFSPSEILETRKKLQEAEKVVSELEGKLAGFGTYDV